MEKDAMEFHTIRTTSTCLPSFGFHTGTLHNTLDGELIPEKIRMIKCSDGLENVTIYKAFTNATIDGSAMLPLLYSDKRLLISDSDVIQAFRTTLPYYECLEKCLEMNACHAVHTVYGEYGGDLGNTGNDVHWCILLHLPTKDNYMCITQTKGSAAYTPASAFQYMENWEPLPTQAKNNLHNDYLQKSMALFIKGKVI